jgi:hypothetical protein
MKKTKQKSKKSSKQAHRACTYKLPASAEEPKELVHTKYEEKPVVKGKSKYEDYEEEKEEEEVTEA